MSALPKRTRPIFYDSWEDCWAAQRAPHKRKYRMLDALAVVRSKKLPRKFRPILLYYALHRLDRPFSNPSGIRMARAVGSNRTDARSRLLKARKKKWVQWFSTKTHNTSPVALNSVRFRGFDPNSLGPVGPQAYPMVKAARRIMVEAEGHALIENPKLRTALATILVASCQHGAVRLTPEKLAKFLGCSPRTAMARLRRLQRTGWVVINWIGRGRFRVAPASKILFEHKLGRDENVEKAYHNLLLPDRVIKNRLLNERPECFMRSEDSETIPNSLRGREEPFSDQQKRDWFTKLVFYRARKKCESLKQFTEEDSFEQGERQEKVCRWVDRQFNRGDLSFDMSINYSDRMEGLITDTLSSPGSVRRKDRLFIKGLTRG